MAVMGESVDKHLQFFGLAVTEILKVNVLFQRTLAKQKGKGYAL